MRSDKKHIVDELEVKHVPQPDETYFLRLKEQILQELPEHQAVKIIPLYKRWYIWSGAAAAVLVLFTLVNFYRTQQTTYSSVDFSSVSKEEILNYLNENVEEMEDLELVNHISLATTWFDSTAHEVMKPEIKTSIPSKSTDDMFETIERDEILEYLKNEEISIDELLID